VTGESVLTLGRGAANSTQRCGHCGQIADALNVRGINAPRGGQWHATSVRNAMARA